MLLIINIICASKDFNSKPYLEQPKNIFSITASIKKATKRQESGHTVCYML